MNSPHQRRVSNLISPIPPHPPKAERWDIDLKYSALSEQDEKCATVELSFQHVLSGSELRSLFCANPAHEILGAMKAKISPRKLIVQIECSDLDDLVVQSVVQNDFELSYDDARSLAMAVLRFLLPEVEYLSAEGIGSVVNIDTWLNTMFHDESSHRLARLLRRSTIEEISDAK